MRGLKAGDLILEHHVGIWHLVLKVQLLNNNYMRFQYLDLKSFRKFWFSTKVEENIYFTVYPVHRR